MTEELRKCTECKNEKPLSKFVKGKVKKDKILYRYLCKECQNSRVRSGEKIPKEKKLDTRFKKGHKGGIRFPKGNISWSKLNKGRYNLPRKSIERGSAKYSEWVQKVKERDNYICRECGSTKQIEAHHMYDFDRYIDKRFDIDNGVSLCKSCHMRITRILKRFKNCNLIWNKD